jgi:hypothetical protein
MDSVFVYRSPIIKTDLYKCRVYSGRILWGIQKANGVDEGMRWIPQDVKIFHSIDGDVLTINVVKSEGSKNETTYSIKRLKKLVPIN